MGTIRNGANEASPAKPEASSAAAGVTSESNRKPAYATHNRQPATLFCCLLRVAWGGAGRISKTSILFYRPRLQRGCPGTAIVSLLFDVCTDSIFTSFDTLKMYFLRHPRFKRGRWGAVMVQIWGEPEAKLKAV